MPADTLAAQKREMDHIERRYVQCRKKRELGSGRQTDCRQALISKTMNISTVKPKGIHSR